MTPSLEPIAPEDLHLAWPLILPGLKEVHKRSASTWIPEDVYSAVRTGHSSLYLGYVDGDYEGFMVLTPSHTWDGRVMHIWCVYSRGNQDVLNIFCPNLEKLARACGAKRITFWGPIAWERYGIGKLGYKAMQTEFVKEL